MSQPVPMTAATIRTLAFAEYDFVSIDADLGTLTDRLRACGGDSPRCKVACRQLRTVRRMLRQVLAGLDEEVTEAVRAAESLPGAPF